MNVGIVTFHASHNYGSMLQAYALQQTVMELGHACQIINLRTDVQKELYKPFCLQKKLKRKIKALLFPRLAYLDYKKQNRYEAFLNNHLILTPKEYGSPEELANVDLEFDAYISGSDQIWNTSCLDNLPSYFLDFVKSGRKIAYAPSMGPTPETQVTKKFHPFIKEKVCRYDAVSVREKRTAEALKQICGIDAEVVADPTLLLSDGQWSRLAGNVPLVKGDYIFLYTPWYSSYKELYEQAAAIAERENVKVVCTILDGYSEWHKNPRFEYFTTAGPMEFLNLAKHSRFTMCGSFHGVVFSLIFNKPFYAHKGMEDARISQLLRITGLEDTEILPETVPNRKLDFDRGKLNSFIEESIMFLRESLQ